MRKLNIPGFLGLSLLLIAALRPAQACDVNERPISSPPVDTRTGDSKKQPEITFKTDGNDVVTSIQVTANNSPHTLSTSYRIGADNVVTLHYTLIQCSDRFVRSIKKVTIEWRLKNFAALPTPLLNYRVDAATLALSAHELKSLTAQMQFLLDEPEPLAQRLEQGVEAVIISRTIADRNDRIGEILVNVTKGNGLLSGGKARVVIRNNVKIEKMQDGKRLSAGLSDLKDGAKIQFSGFRAVAESYPVQVSPTHILILDPSELELRSQGEQEAERDIAKGILGLRVFGLRRTWSDEYHRLLQSKLGVQVTVVGGCVITDESVKAMGYSARMQKEIAARFGDKALENLAEEARLAQTGISPSIP